MTTLCGMKKKGKGIKNEVVMPGRAKVKQGKGKVRPYEEAKKC